VRVPQGGTRMYCPHCRDIRVCKGLSPTDLGMPSEQRMYQEEYQDIQWFRRGRRCQTCRGVFVTAEVHEDFLDELIELRDALADLKQHSEEYIRQSKSASESLANLSNSLAVLRALHVYEQS
jgi:hypothetical protein